MDAVSVDIEKGIAKEIAGNDWGLDVDVHRMYGSPRVPLEQLDILRIDVCHWQTTIDQEAEGLLSYLVETDILVRKRFGQNEQWPDGTIPPEEIDPLLKLMQDLEEFFMPCSGTSPLKTGRQLADVPDAHYEPERKRKFADYLRPQLEQLRQFTGWFRIAYGFTKATG